MNTKLTCKLVQKALNKLAVVQAEAADVRGEGGGEGRGTGGREREEAGLLTSTPHSHTTCELAILNSSVSRPHRTDGWPSKIIESPG